MPSVLDTRGRVLRNLRVSVTDRCNLRCGYCMPEEEYVWLPREDILHFGEIAALADVFLDLGVDKVRLTGGEPLLRRDLPRLVRMLAAKPRIRDLAMTTNGVLLAEHAPALKAAGLHRVTVSLDTLDPQRFARLRRGSRRPSSTRSSSAASTTTSSATSSSSPAACRPRFASSSTWTWAEPPAGRSTRS